MKTLQDYGIDIPNGATGHTRTTCPACSHERRKSSDKCLSVDVERGLFFCHHCGHSGGLKDESKKEIQQYFVKPTYKAKTNLPPKVIEWFESRGIPENILALNHIGYGKSFKDKNGIQFPYYKDGEVVNIKHRTHDKQFRQEKNAEKCLYRFDNIAQCDGDTLIICEGEIDALSFQVAGFSMVTSIPDGAPSADAKEFNSKFDFLKSAEEIIGNYKNVIIAVDNDKPGKRLEEELVRRIGAEKCCRVEYPECCKDANDVLVNHGKEALRKTIEKAIPYPVAGLFSVMDYKSEVLSLYDKGVNRGTLTGWKQLDEFYSVRPCEMTIVTGIPGSGKSNFCDNLAVNLAKEHGWRFAFFSPENWPVERHIQSIMEKVEQKPFARDGRFANRMTREDVKESLKLMNDYFHFIYPEDEMLTVDTILEKAKISIFRYGINGLVVDPWNEMDHVYERGDNEAKYLSRALTKIRQFARKNGVHIWIVAHPRNLTKDEDGNYKPPTMYEISGGAHWRNKADNGLCVHRPDSSTDITEVFVQKIRFREVGKKGKAILKFCRDTGQYEDNNYL